MVAPRAYAGENRQDHSEAMIERHRNAEPIRLAEIQCLSDKTRIVHHIMMRERGALRASGGAACELDIDRVVAIERFLANCDATPLRQKVCIVQHVRHAAFAHANDPFEPGQLGTNRLEHLQVLRSLHLLGGDDDPASRYAKRVFQLGETIGRIDIHENEAESCGRELRHQPLDAVGRPDPDAIALAKAELLQPGGEGIDLVRELLPAPADALLAEYHGQSVRESRGRLCEQRRNREIAERRIRCAAHVRARLGMSHFFLPLACLPVKETVQRDGASLLPIGLQIVPT